MRRMLCFGDSNTYGYDPRGGRYDENTRWTKRLDALLGDGWTVVEEGFNGRTCVMDDPTEGGYKSGAAYLPPCLMSHSPLDLVAIMLGGNDTKQRFGLNPMTIGEGIMQLIRLTRLYAVDAAGNPSRILLIAPPPFREELRRTRYWDVFGPQALEISRGLGPEYARVARLLRCEFLDAGTVAKLSEIDALHFTPEDHRRLAEAVCEKVKNIFKD